MEPTQTQEAIARGVAQYLVISARNTSTFGPEIPGPGEGVGLHVIAGHGENRVNDGVAHAVTHVGEVGWEIADEVEQAAQAMLAREVTTDERDDLLASAFGIAPAVVELSRRIIEEATSRQGRRPTTDDRGARPARDGLANHWA